MKEITLEQFPQDVSQLIAEAQRQRILITRNGEPVAFVVGIENKDEEDFRLQTSPEFWRMIEERRREPTIPLEKLMSELFPEESDPPAGSNDKQ
jgi:prevent-host-death family protein